MFSAEEVPEVFWCTGACDKIYKRSLLQDDGLVFSEGLVFDDHVFGFEALTKARRIALVGERLYHYQRNQAGSASPWENFQ